MPDLPNRRKHEADLAAAIALAFRRAERSPRTIDWQAFAAELAAAVKSPLVSAWSEAAAQMGAMDPQQTGQAWADSYGAALAGEIAARTRDAIESQPEGALLAAALAVVFGAERAMMIAITEITRAITAAEGWFAIQAGSELAAWWYTEADGRVCEVCAPLHDTPRSAWVDVAPAGPPAHPRCRCWLEWRAAA